MKAPERDGTPLSPAEAEIAPPSQDAIERLLHQLFSTLNQMMEAQEDLEAVTHRAIRLHAALVRLEAEFSPVVAKMLVRTGVV